MLAEFSSQELFLLDMTISLQIIILIDLLILTELGEKLGATIVLSNFVNKLQSNSYWLIVFGKIFFIGQSLKNVQVMFSFHKPLKFF